MEIDGKEYVLLNADDRIPTKKNQMKKVCKVSASFYVAIDYWLT